MTNEREPTIDDLMPYLELFHGRDCFEIPRDTGGPADCTCGRNQTTRRMASIRERAKVPPDVLATASAALQQRVDDMGSRYQNQVDNARAVNSTRE